MNFKVAFPKAGQNTISLTVSSIGSTMMGLEVEQQGRTHTMLSGSPMGFKTDPVNDFGSRTFEFPVFVQPFDQIHNVAGTMPGSSLNIELLSTATEITAGQPAPLVITVTRGNDSSMITHPDLQVTVMDSATGYILSESAPVEDMMTMHGAIHGHTGVMTLTPTFPMSGRYVIDIDLQPSPLSNYFWGHAHTQFNIFVTEPAFNAATAQTPVQNSSSNVNNTNTVDIVGLEAPFFVPNVLNIKAGTTITFVNTDGNVHTVTSVKAGTVERDGTFDSGFLTAAKTFSYTFSTPGTYNYICTIHTHMHGVINVS
jgi:plastocyanin